VRHHRGADVATVRTDPLGPVDPVTDPQLRRTLHFPPGNGKMFRLGAISDRNGRQALARFAQRVDERG